MNLGELGSLNCVFENCSTFASESSPAEVIPFFEGHQGEFNEHLTREKHSDPVGAAQKELELFGYYNLSFRHRDLQLQDRDYYYAAKHGYDALSRPGSAGLTYFPKTRTLNIHQDIDFSDADIQLRTTKIERVALGQLQFLNHFAPLLKPAYGYIMPVIDPEYDPIPSEEFRETGTVAYLCWANYFGPQIVAQVGEDFLREAPGWRIVDLPCGGFLYVTTPSFLEWHLGKHRALVRYFRQKFPDIEEL